MVGWLLECDFWNVECDLECGMWLLECGMSLLECKNIFWYKMLRFNYKSELSNFYAFSKRSSCSSTRTFRYFAWHLSSETIPKSKETFATTIMQLQISLKKYIKFSKNSIGWLAQKTSECGMWNVECEIFQYGMWKINFNRAKHFIN